MTSCYRKANTTVIGDTSTVDGACSLITTDELVSPCCPIKSDVLGSGNLCLSDYLCWESGPPSGGSGFLTASCTDETYASGECTEHCTDNPVPDVIYNPDTGLWACCSWTYENGINCANPTTETWAAPAPQVLLNAASASSSIISTSSTTSSSSSSTSASITTSASTTTSGSSTITSTATSSPPSSASSSASSSSSSSSSGLSTGAKAGIAVGVILLVVLVAFAIFFAWSRGKRSRRDHADNRYEAPPPANADGERKSWLSHGGMGSKYRDYSPPAVEMHSNSTNELPANAPLRHADSRQGFAELQ